MFDTLEFFKKMVAAGMLEEQAKGLCGALNDALAQAIYGIKQTTNYRMKTKINVSDS